VGGRAGAGAGALVGTFGLVRFVGPARPGGAARRVLAARLGSAAGQHVLAAQLGSAPRQLAPSARPNPP